MKVCDFIFRKSKPVYRRPAPPLCKKKIGERVSILDVFRGWGVCRQAKEVVNIKLSLFLCHSKTVVNIGTISLECLDNQPIKSLPVFGVVTSLDSISASLIQTVSREFATHLDQTTMKHGNEILYA